MEDNIIEKHWLTFCKDVLKDATEQQLETCHKVFFAGALVVFSQLVVDIEESGEKHVAKIQSISNELTAFKGEVFVKAEEERKKKYKDSDITAKMGHA